ncbi:MAG: hypothetical protein CMJ33_08620 [Phycisphaerae bacterium]|nr:hypothetical protein [Phycisphaerae bacterium]
MARLKTILCRTAGFGVVFLAMGCQSGYRNSAAGLVSLERQGAYVAAADLAAEEARNHLDDETDRVIFLLEAGRTAQIAGRVDDSIRFYEQAYEIIRPFLDSEAEARVTEAITTTVVNQTLAEYRGTPVERIMLSTLQALNRLMMGEFDQARIELNRARDWQQDAVDKASKEIERAEKRLEKKAGSEGISRKALKVPSELRSIQESMGDLTPYADWRNPFTSWLRGIFLMANAVDSGDLGNARFDLREVISMMPSFEPVAGPDLAALESASLTPTTWVVFMSGLAPEYEEYRLDIPIPIGNVNYVAAAFPVLKSMKGSLAGLVISDGDVESEGALLANIDAMVAADFEKRLPVIVMQEVLSMALKTTATWAASQAAGDGSGLVNLIGIVYQAATTAADLRSWRTIPKNIYAARILTPDAGFVTVRTSEGRELGDMEVVPGAFNLLVVTLPGSGPHAPSTQSIRLDPGPRLDENTLPESGNTSEVGSSGGRNERSIPG